MEQNPYAPPTRDGASAHVGLTSPREAALAGQCPHCGSSIVNKPGFTWWGGALGPRMLKHRVCGSCKFGFNAETGESNRNKIIVYVVVVNAIVLALFAMFWSSR